MLSRTARPSGRAGTAYTFTVAAANVVGVGPVSVGSPPVTPTPAGVSGVVVADHYGGDSDSLSWASGSDGG